MLLQLPEVLVGAELAGLVQDALASPAYPVVSRTRTACLVGTAAAPPAPRGLAVEAGGEAEFHASAFTPSGFWT